MLRDSYAEDDLIELLVERHVENSAAEQWQHMLSNLHAKQRAFVEDPATRKCALKGRRAGGSFAAAAWLSQQWQDWPNVMSLFVAMTKEHAKGILWPTLEALSHQYSWDLVFNNLELTATFPNGYCIALKGAKDRVQVEKLRGFANGLRRVLVDECGGFTAHDALFRYMLSSVLSPQLMDHRHRGGGQMALVSSPGIDPRGLFYERTTGVDHMGRTVPSWSTHHWTALDNTFLDAAGYLLEELESGNHILDETTPEVMVQWLVALKDVPQKDPRWQEVNSRLSASFRREYLAQWVKDSQSLIYQASQKNMLPDGWALPPGTYRIIIGCDIGWGDGNGFSIAAKSIAQPEVFLLRSYYRPEMSTAQIAQELQALSKDFRTGEIYVDTGGEGERLLMDLVNYGVLAQAARKGRKKPRIEYVRSLLDTNTLQLVPSECGDLLTEWAALPWDEERTVHRPGFVDDVSDSALMALMPLSTLYVPAKAKPPASGTPEAVKARDDWERQQAVRAGKRAVRHETRRSRRRL